MGTVSVGATVVLGTFGQQGLLLKEDMRIIEVVREIAEVIPLTKGRTLSASQLLERFLFDKDKQYQYVSTLSGGERRRLYLFTVLMRNPNVLILDEPTNDLDILTLNVLEDYLMDFPGVILIVTHDRYFMDKIVDHLFIFEGEGRIRDYNGTYTEYRAWLREKQREERQQASPEKAEAAPKRSRTQHPNQKALNRIEKELEKLESRKQEIHHTFAENTPDPDTIRTLGAELDTIAKRIEELEGEWMLLADED